MTSFDVSQLPGRAQELKEAAIKVYTDNAPTGYAGYESGGAYTARANAEKEMSGVENIYDDFLDMPAPEDFQWVFDDIPQAMAKLTVTAHDKDPVSGKSVLSGYNGDLTLISSDGALLSPTSWTGTAAEEYQKNFGNRFVPTASAQYAACSVLLNAVAAEAAVWATMRKDLDNLSSDAIEKMKHSGDRSPGGWSAALLIAGAVLAIPVTDGLSAAALPAVGAGAVAAGVGIDLASEKGEGPDKFGLDAGSPDKVISSLKEALGKLKTHCVTQETKIVTAMNNATTKLDDPSFWQEFCLPTPAIANAPHHGVHDTDYGGYFG